MFQPFNGFVALARRFFSESASSQWLEGAVVGKDQKLMIDYVALDNQLAAPDL